MDHIDGNLCTHLIYAFFGVSVDGQVQSRDTYLDYDQEYISKAIQLKVQYPHLKVLASIGGYNEGSYRFSMVARSDDIRQKFAMNVLDFVNLHKFDGVVIDWEWPGLRDGDSSIDKANFNLLLRELNYW